MPLAHAVYFDRSRPGATRLGVAHRALVVLYRIKAVRLLNCRSEFGVVKILGVAMRDCRIVVNFGGNWFDGQLDNNAIQVR
jgi:hypothetical protein